MIQKSYNSIIELYVYFGSYVVLKKIVLLFVFIFSIFQQPVWSENLKNNEYAATDIYQNNVPSILYIQTQDSSGSGVILKEDGTFLTCFHVIANADYIIVKLEDGSMYSVNGFKYINPLSDVAILTLDTTRKFKPIKINPNNKLKIGEKVYAISNPQGLQFVFSDGMINQYTKDYIQFSAPISPGSSGGALLNSNGNLLGIITSQYNLSDAQNMNFALPNEYYISKINNKKIVNEENINWVDFLSKNVSNDEFSIITDYALNNNNTVMWYKYLRTTFLPIQNQIPIPIYPVLGYVALFTGYYEDAIIWYNLAYENDYNKKIDSFGLMLAYGYNEGITSKDYNKWLDIVIKNYGNELMILSESYKNCMNEYKDMTHCEEHFLIILLEYIRENTNFNWK